MLSAAIRRTLLGRARSFGSRAAVDIIDRAYTDLFVLGMLSKSC